MGVVAAVETVVDEGAGGVSVTSTSMRGMLASHGTTETHGTARMEGAGITGEGDVANLRAILTLPRTKPRTIRTGGTRHKITTRTTNRAGTEDRLNRHMIRGLHINNLPTEVAEGEGGEGTIPDTVARMAAGRVGTAEGEEGVNRTAAVDIVTKVKEPREGGMGMVAPVVDTINPLRTAVTAEEVTMEVVDIIPAEAINPAQVTSPVDRTAPVSSLTGTKGDTTKEVEVVGEGTDYPDTPQTCIRKCCSGSLPFIYSRPASSRL